MPILTTGWSRRLATAVAALALAAVSLAMPASAHADWSPQTSGTTAHLNGASFPDASNGWAVGAGGTILATTNGGTTWSPQTSGTSSHLNGVYFFNASFGWAVGAGGTILATTDGGTTWSPQTSGTSSHLNGVHFPWFNHGWVVGDGGTILVTTNGGATWTSQSSGTSSHLKGVAFHGILDGLAVGDGGTIVATTDGGTIWSPQTSGTSSHLNGVDVPDWFEGWAVGAGGTIAYTDGATWSPQTSGTTEALNSVSFPSYSPSSNGWVVGNNGRILATMNEGAIWMFQDSTTTRHLNSVSFPDASNGWAVGNNGTIRHYEGASIGDLVWEDTNGNGVQDPGEGGLGIAGVALTLLDGSSNPLATTTTAADGSYLFAGLAAGDYTVVVDAGNFASGGPLEGYSSTTGGNSQGLTLAAGQEALAHDFGYYLPGSIGDLVWEDTNGNGVQNPGESGLANVALTLLDGSSNPLATTTTAADGSYLFAGLAAGDYTVVVDAANFTSGGPLEGYVSTTGGNSQGLTLAAGQQALAQDFGYRLESTPTPTPSPSPSPTSPPASTPTPTPSPDGDSEIGGWLSTTGGALGLLATLGAVLVLAGVSLHRLGRPGKDR